MARTDALDRPEVSTGEPAGATVAARLPDGTAGARSSGFRPGVAGRVACGDRPSAGLAVQEASAAGGDNSSRVSSSSSASSSRSHAAASRSTSSRGLAPTVSRCSGSRAARNRPTESVGIPCSFSPGGVPSRPRMAKGCRAGCPTRPGDTLMAPAHWRSCDGGALGNAVTCWEAPFGNRPLSADDHHPPGHLG